MKWIALVVLAIVAAGCLDATPAPPATGASPATSPTGGAAAAAGPAWSFVDTDGVTHTRDAPAANATVLFFMATWCSSCRATAPTLSDVHADYESRGVRTYSLTFDPSETEADLEAWKERYDQPWPHAVDSTLARTFDVRSQSTVILLDADGRVLQAWGYGRVTNDALRTALDEALKA